MSTISQALTWSVETIKEVSDSPNLDAQVLLANTLDKPRSWVITHPEAKLSPANYHRFQAGINALRQGKPLPYIIGKKEFYGLDFFVTPDTLIPRPETELIVEHALDLLGESKHYHLAADIGTGSGCIAIALAKNSSGVGIFASDISMPALQIAQKNAVHHRVNEKIHFLQCNLLPALSVRFDLICANLPYIPSKTLPKLKVYGHEPQLALDGGESGLEYIAKLIANAPIYSKSGGNLLIEIDDFQGEQVLSIAQTHFPSSDIYLHEDLNHQNRLLEIRLP